MHGFFQSVHQLSNIPFDPYKSTSFIVSEIIGSSKSSENKNVSAATILGNKLVPIGKQVTLRTQF